MIALRDLNLVYDAVVSLRDQEWTLARHSLPGDKHAHSMKRMVPTIAKELGIMFVEMKVEEGMELDEAQHVLDQIHE